ncbi:uncharacterized protein L203_101081 [Cryptococcus depauperatus CBS 7841]|uniref:UBC core domain-containing protein n=1 Tax=Cryptococcus depauperatus CBS 7841 TaxID=1295531 RepID=A0A1E3IKC5_9TREE|nr:ubiquitin-conjugating enzyme E2 J1 [Cryptococcus depauperatus CBS 7841]
MASPPSSKKLNMRSTAVKRIMQEATELALANANVDGFVAAPLEDDIFEWHCTLRGVPGSEFDGGLYHLRIVLPPSYPMSAPDIILLTPNGRFELGKKICIDGLTSFHAGSWQPAWGVRTSIIGLRSFWMQGGEALSAIGALDYSKEERKRLARLSVDWKCPTCGVKNEEMLKIYTPKAAHDDLRGKEVDHTGEEKSGFEKYSVEKEQSETSAEDQSAEPPQQVIAAASTSEEATHSHASSLPATTAIINSITPDVPSLTGPVAQHSPSPTIVVPSHETSRVVPLWLDHLIGLLCILLGLAICKRVGTYIMSP